MQRRITKVLKMRPPEILVMIEEAAGILMFNGKKRKSIEGHCKKKNKKLKRL